MTGHLIVCEGSLKLHYLHSHCSIVAIKNQLMTWLGTKCLARMWAFNLKMVPIQVCPKKAVLQYNLFPDIIVENKIIKHVTNCKYLGVTLDEDLTFTHHIDDEFFLK